MRRGMDMKTTKSIYAEIEISDHVKHTRVARPPFVDC